MIPSIVHVTCTHPADDGRITAKQLGTLLDRYERIWLVALPPAGPVDPRITVLPTDPLRRFRHLREPWATLNAAISQIPEPRIIHAHEPASVLAAAHFRWADRGRLIYDAHEYHGLMCAQDARGWRRPVIRRIGDRRDRLAARRSGHVITVNDDLAGTYRRWNPDVRVIANAPLDLDDASYGRQSAARDPRRVLYMGSLTVPRGSRTMFDAFDRLSRSHPEGRMELIGPVDDDPTRAAIGRLPRNVVHHGRLSALEATGHLPTASIGLVPFEAIPRYGVRPVKLLEYAIAGLSIICTEGGAKAEWVRSHGAGAVIPAGDPDAMAEAIGLRLADPDRARAEGDRARAAARPETWPRDEGPRLLQLYEELVG